MRLFFIYVLFIGFTSPLLGQSVDQRRVILNDGTDFKARLLSQNFDSLHFESEIGETFWVARNTIAELLPVNAHYVPEPISDDGELPSESSPSQSDSSSYNDVVLDNVRFVYFTENGIKKVGILLESHPDSLRIAELPSKWIPNSVDVQKSANDVSPMAENRDVRAAETPSLEPSKKNRRLANVSLPKVSLPKIKTKNMPLFDASNPIQDVGQIPFSVSTSKQHRDGFHYYNRFLGIHQFNKYVGSVVSATAMFTTIPEDESNFMLVGLNFDLLNRPNFLFGIGTYMITDIDYFAAFGITLNFEQRVSPNFHYEVMTGVVSLGYGVSGLLKAGGIYSLRQDWDLVGEFAIYPTENNYTAAFGPAFSMVGRKKFSKWYGDFGVWSLSEINFFPLPYVGFGFRF